MVILGLTGSIGMGKSTAAAMFEYLSVPVFDSDICVHNLYKNPEVISNIIAHFPESWNSKKKIIDKKYLSQLIFTESDNEIERYKAQENKYLLESIIHPFVLEEQEKFIRRNRILKRKICVIDIPLLFETGANHRMDFVATVSAPFFIQSKRVLSRPDMTIEKFNAILEAQMPDEQKRKMSDFIIQTGCNRAEILKQIKKIIKKLSK